MPCRHFVFIFAGIFVAIVANQHQLEARIGDPTNEIKALLDAQVKAWNDGDLEGFMAGYWNSPDLTFFSGSDITTGWQPTLDRYRKRYQSEGREMGNLTFSDLQISAATSEMAWVRGRWRVVTSKETLGGLFTLILKKRPEGWRIVHDHTSAGQAPATQPASGAKKN
jgi:beta-aspartyl-peptidase (threonine type)